MHTPNRSRFSFRRSRGLLLLSLKLLAVSLLAVAPRLLVG